MKALGIVVSASFSVVLAVTCCQPQASLNHKATEEKTMDADKRHPMVSREEQIRRAKKLAAEIGDEGMKAVSLRGPIDTGISKADLEEEAKRALESLEKSRNAKDAELQAVRTAIESFKAAKLDRRETAREVIQLVKQGMYSSEVKAILGEPDKKKEEGALWFYTVYYSSFLLVQFDSDGRVRKVLIK